MGSHMLDRDCVAEEVRRRDLLASQGRARKGRLPLRGVVAALLIRTGERLQGAPVVEAPAVVGAAFGR